jgi:GNAT superfamily N-acetyltransferase
MTPHLQIRSATTRDISRILPLWEALAALHGELDEALAVEPGVVRDYAEFLWETIGRSDACVMLGLDGDRTVSFALGRIQVLPLPFRERRRGWIQDVFTVPDRRREGIGRKVVEALLAWFERRGVALVELTVAVANPEALRFWERLGFVTYMSRMKRVSGRGHGA